MTTFIKVIMIGGICILVLFNLYLSSYWNEKSGDNNVTANESRFHKTRRRDDLANDTNKIIITTPILTSKVHPTKSSFIDKIINYTTTAASSNSSNTTTNKLIVTDENNSNNDRILFNITKQCKEPDLRDAGPIRPNKTMETLEVIEAELVNFLKPGGAFEPKDCKAKDHVAIVVPFRDRYAHLSIFLRNIHKFLMKQHIAYRIFIIEQTNGQAFNRAALMNIGFLEANKLYPWDCFIFHDVDLLPLDERNLYNCPRQPRHMSVAIDTLNFKLPYRTIFGGVSAMTRTHFQAVNGFSNSYFGWGGEDDDMSNRLKHANLFISRYPSNIARYTMLKHTKEKANPKRFENLVNGISKIETDGINSIKYEIYSFKEFPTFTWYLAELKITEQKSQT